MSVSVRSLPPSNTNVVGNKDHHVGNPPKSFVNPWPSSTQLGLASAMQHRFGNKAEKNNVPVPQGPDGTRSEELVKVLRPDWAANQKDRLRATWIGHASFLVETPVEAGAERGVRILFDPVFAERTSPFTWLGPKRYTPTPCLPDELPDVDVVCISHNHYDHLDFTFISELYRKRKGHLHILAGLNNKAWFTQHVGCQTDEVSDLDWWDSCEVKVEGVGSLRLTCCPTQHGSARSLSDRDHTLWCSWALEAGDKKLYFAGDTAYQAVGTPSPCPVFPTIGQTLGPFDISLLPIGLMTPATFMGTVHATPEQSLQIHKEIKSKLSIGMHYGTVRGGISAQYEDVRDPPRRWREAAEKEGLWRGGGVEGTGTPVDTSKHGVGLCHVGETVVI